MPAVATPDRTQSELARWQLAQAIHYSRDSFEQFTRTTHHAYIPNWHHRVMAKELQDFADGKTENLALFMPPRHGKSTQGSRHLPAYILGRNPNASIIATSYSMELAQDMNLDVQRIIDDDTYQRIFPNTRLAGRKRSDETARGRWVRRMDRFDVVGHRGYYVCAGVGGSINGRGCDIGIIDDPIRNAADAHSETIRKTVWDWYLSVFRTRLSPRGRVLLIQTRWHEDDLAGRVLALAKADARAPQWRVVSFPAILDELTPGDPRQVGDPLWPDAYSLQFLQQMRASSAYFFSALYQQRPAPAEGGLVKRAWLSANYYREVPADLDEVVISADLSFKDGDDSDFVAIHVWGRKGANRYLLDRRHHKLDFSATLTALREVIALYPGRSILVEDKANGPAVVSSLRNEVPGIIAVDPKSSKLARLVAVSPEIEAGNVHLPDPSLKPWVSEVVEEIVAFPNAAHDDDVDAMTQALLRFKGSADGFFQFLQAEYQASQQRRTAAVEPEPITRPSGHRRQILED